MVNVGKYTSPMDPMGRDSWMYLDPKTYLLGEIPLKKCPPKSGYLRGYNPYVEMIHQGWRFRLESKPNPGVSNIYIDPACYHLWRIVSENAVGDRSATLKTQLQIWKDGNSMMFPENHWILQEKGVRDSAAAQGSSGISAIFGT